MNFIFISPNFPKIYSQFVKALNERGVNVLGIGDEPYQDLNDELKSNLKEYCQVSNMNNLDWMKNTIHYLQDKYGKIDFIESNNEWWLMSDAKLRECFGVNTGFYTKDMDTIKYKSKMKSVFNKAGMKTARYIIATDLNHSLEFVKEVGYPLFAKPDSGVGAIDTFKITNDRELIQFHKLKHDEIYIIEEYIEGFIISFDGICDIDGNVVIAFQETFPKPIAEVSHDDEDMYYYASLDLNDDFYKKGQQVVKSFNISKRCFHIEFWCLTKDKIGLANKGDIIALECNMRCPGGNTPDLLSLALDESFYDIYADVITTNKTILDIKKKHYIAISVSRKNRFHYLYEDQDIRKQYDKNICKHFYNNIEISKVMGDECYYARFDSIKEALDFQKFVRNKQ